MEKLCGAFAKLEKFDAASIEAALKATAAELGVKVGVLVHPVRLACTGNPNGPSLYHLLEVMGKEKTLGRMGKGMSLMG
jgi:glutamyl-tRNA synthetase